VPATLGLLALALASCDRSGTDLLPNPGDQFSPVIEAGKLHVLSAAELQEFQASSDPKTWCAQTDETGALRCLFDQVGPPDAGVRGGATYTFNGTGDYVCLIVDPETVFWNQSIAREGRDEDYSYPDMEADDGDMDMFAGLSTYYTGSPGIELGDFKGYYTDSLGREISIEYGECRMRGSPQSEITNAHAGRATPEWCDIDTQQREGIEYTVVLDTFSVPLDDGVLSFVAMAVDGRCSSIDSPQGVTECTVMGESLDPDGGYRSCASTMEYASCATSLESDFGADWTPLKAFCCANPGMCGQSPPEDICFGFDRDTFCAAEPDYCCD